jgi:hypothetical protein
MSFTEGPSHERTDIVVETPVAPVYAVPNAGQVVAPVVPVATAVAGGQVRTAYSTRFAPDAIIAAVVGIVILVVGLIAIVRCGFDGKLSEPVREVVGFTHTTLLGLIEIGLGGGLLLAGATRSRSGALFFGSVLGIAGFVGAVQTSSFDTSLALESSMAWLAVFAGVIVVLAALMLPRYARHSTTVSQV